MSAAGMPIQDGHGAPPRKLLWSTGAIALLLSLAAFALWGTNGAGMLFDLVVALCT